MTDRLGSNLGRIVAACSELFQAGTTEPLHAMLDERVVWEGMVPGEFCHNRDEVIGRLSHVPRTARITRIEAEESGDLVMVSVDGPDFRGDDLSRSGPRSLSFTFKDGRVTRMKSFATRDEAFRALGGD
ncbi:MAG: hypothetical protein ACHQ0J_05815 [Candidatus Dormibacterales bacterium]